MKSTSFALGALIASVAVAQPHRHHQHRDKHHKREVVWVTDVEYVYETVAVIHTVWVPPGFVPPATEVTTSSSSSYPAAPPNPPNKYFENGHAEVKSKPAVSLPSIPVLNYVPPVPNPTPVAPTTPPAPEYHASPAPAPAPAPAPEPSPSPAYVAPAPAAPPVYSPPVYDAPAVDPPAPVYSAPAPAPETPAPAAPAPVPTYAATPSESTGGACSSGSPCEGDITYYEAGLGACGTTNDGSTEKVIALPHGMMGTQSNGNPYCGMTVTIKLGSKTVQATVVDKCMGCTGNSIDLSNAAFEELADFAVGRTQATWWFN
ncbi:unnamed protein product [Diplocarpon coronariae]